MEGRARRHSAATGGPRAVFPVRVAALLALSVAALLAVPVAPACYQ